MEENQESRNKPLQLWSIDIWQGWQENSMVKNSLLNKWDSWISSWEKNKCICTSYHIQIFTQNLPKT